MDVSATNEVEFEKVDKASDLENWSFKKKYCDISLLKLCFAVGVSLRRR